jgi:hypothetical protein
LQAGAKVIHIPLALETHNIAGPEAFHKLWGVFKPRHVGGFGKRDVMEIPNDHVRSEASDKFWHQHELIVLDENSPTFGYNMTDSLSKKSIDLTIACPPRL